MTPKDFRQKLEQQFICRTVPHPGWDTPGLIEVQTDITPLDLEMSWTEMSRVRYTFALHTVVDTAEKTPGTVKGDQVSRNMWDYMYGDLFRKLSEIRYIAAHGTRDQVIAAFDKFYREEVKP